MARRSSDTQEVVAARYTVVQQGDQFVVVDNETGGQVATSGSQEGADQVAADLEQRASWAKEAGTDNPAPIDPTVPVEPTEPVVDPVDPAQQ